MTAEQLSRSVEAALTTRGSPVAFRIEGPVFELRGHVVDSVV